MEPTACKSKTTPELWKKEEEERITQQGAKIQSKISSAPATSP